MRHGLGTVPGAVTRGRRAARALRGAGSEAGALGWESEIRGSLRSQTAGSWEGDQGAGRGPRSHSSGGRPAFTSTCVHTPPPLLAAQRCSVRPHTSRQHEAPL